MKLDLLLISFLCLSGIVLADEPLIDPALAPDAKGRAIAEEVIRREDGYGDTVVEVEMTLGNIEGQERTRKLTWMTLENNEPGAGDRSLTIFHEPRDIAGTAFLSHTKIGDDDDQWLYLPSLKRVKRIAAANKSSAFVGSEFAYEDLLSDEVERFEYLWLRNDDCDGEQCFVIERRPRYGDSGYLRQHVWIDQAEFRPQRIDYFDLRDRLLKTLTFHDYRLYLDRFWRAQEMRMENHQSGKFTVLRFGEFRFQTGLTERDFDPSALRRLR